MLRQQLAEAAADQPRGAGDGDSERTLGGCRRAVVGWQWLGPPAPMVPGGLATRCLRPGGIETGLAVLRSFAEGAAEGPDDGPDDGEEGAASLDYPGKPPKAIGAATTESGMPKASTRATASGRSSAHSSWTSRWIAFDFADST